ncbi:hypothetical protein [Streptomyces sp. NPDC059753]|uniref:hypothetical protein n=1 Tax=Streptomyces sp. NPDC059753 TaxID=3346933 RepID=UPI003669640B
MAGALDSGSDRGEFDEVGSGAGCVSCLAARGGGIVSNVQGGRGGVGNGYRGSFLRRFREDDHGAGESGSVEGANPFLIG